MRTTAKVFLLVGAAVAAVVPVMPAEAAVTDARISNFSFSPDPVTIHLGDTLKWTNTDNTSHTVTADDGSFTSNSLGTQGTFSHTFDQPGTVGYHCKIHPSMQGTVKVEAATTTTAAAPTTTTTAPASTTTTAPATTTTTARATTTTTVRATTTTRPTTMTVPAAAPAVSATTAPAPLPEEAPPSTQAAVDAASERYGSGGGGAIGLVVAAVLILGGGAGAGWWVIRRRSRSRSVGG